MESEKKYFTSSIISSIVLPEEGSSAVKIEDSMTSSFDNCVSTSKVFMDSISSPKNSILRGSSDVEGKTSKSQPRWLYSPFSETRETFLYPIFLNLLSASALSTSVPFLSLRIVSSISCRDHVGV